MITNGAHRKRQAGQAFTELALLLPVMLVLTMGIIDFGRVFYFDNIMTNAARTGARVASDSSKLDAAVIKAVIADSSPMSVSNGDISIIPSALAPENQRLRGVTVSVTVSYTFRPITPVIGRLFTGGQISIDRTARMVVY